MGQKRKFWADCVVGRLVEARFETLATGEDVAGFQDAVSAAFTKAGPSAVICADWRSADLLAPDVADALIELLKRGNRRFERSGILLSSSQATFGLQVERLVRQAENPSRRTFRDADRMLAWLGEVLGPAELFRARSFLGAASQEVRS